MGDLIATEPVLVEHLAIASGGPATSASLSAVCRLSRVCHRGNLGFPDHVHRGEVIPEGIREVFHCGFHVFFTPFLG